jgi:hypothetical protein
VQCAFLGCDLIRCSNSHTDLTPGYTDAQIEPGPQKQVDWIVNKLGESGPMHKGWGRLHSPCPHIVVCGRF